SVWAVSSAVNRILSFWRCAGLIPATLPLSKNRLSPLCLKVLIILRIIHNVLRVAQRPFPTQHIFFHRINWRNTAVPHPHTLATTGSCWQRPFPTQLFFFHRIERGKYGR